MNRRTAFIQKIINFLITLAVIFAITAVMCSCKHNSLHVGSVINHGQEKEIPKEEDVLPSLQKTLKVDFIDIGQGDAIFIMFLTKNLC
ncbi:MAG: hypothetical protein ACOX24_00740 [Christensenellales bacterium]|jgi:large-conductance mechanosensitive channel